jgi:hypothetical protein
LIYGVIWTSNIRSKWNKLAGITIMVNNQNGEPIEPPKGESPSTAERVILAGPLFVLAQVQDISRQDHSISFVTKQCSIDVDRLGWSVVEVGKLLRTLGPQNYHQSEWCRMDGGRWLPCDAYVIQRMEYNEYSHRELLAEYYVKFSIGPNGAALLIVSCHYQR